MLQSLEPAAVQERPARLDGLQINIGNTNGVGNLPYANKGTPLASSAKLRQAFEEAIDRKTLIRVVFGGRVPGHVHPDRTGERRWYDATKVPCTPYNPKHAKQLVAESGFSHPTVHLLTGTRDEVRLAQFIQAQEDAVGINVVIESVDARRARRGRTRAFRRVLRRLQPGGRRPASARSPVLATRDSATTAATRTRARPDPRATG